MIWCGTAEFLLFATIAGKLNCAPCCLILVSRKRAISNSVFRLEFFRPLFWLIVCIRSFRALSAICAAFFIRVISFGVFWSLNFSKNWLMSVSFVWLFVSLSACDRVREDLFTAILVRSFK